MKDFTFLSAYKVEPDCFTSSPTAFQETGQSDLPPVEWNGEGVSGGGTLYYCPGRIKCKFKCVANSDFSPSFYIDGQCLAVTEVSKAIPGATVLTNHPNYTLEFNCSSAVQLRCVNGENLYSPGYNLQELTNGGYFCMCVHTCMHVTSTLWLVYAHLFYIPSR